MAWQYLEMTPTGWHSAMYSFYWARVAGRMLREDPARLARTILRAPSDGDVIHGDDRLKLLKETLELRPAEVWQAVGAHLLADPSVAITLGWRSEEVALFDALPSDLLLAWAREDVSVRPNLLAQLTKPREILSPLIRGLLVEYGAESAPANILYANFGSGMWSGSMAAREERQLTVASTWLDDPEPAVRAWAERIIDSIKRELPRLRIADEENIL